MLRFNCFEYRRRQRPRLQPDFARFIEIAYSSLMELITQIKIASRQGFLSQQDHDNAYAQSKQIARMLSGLRTSLQRSTN